MVENFLRVQFGSLDEELSDAITPMLQLPPGELTRLVLTLSREELLKRVGGQLAEEVSGGNLKNLL